MAVTIASLEYQSKAPILHTVLKDVYSWFTEISTVEGYKGKATIANYKVSNDLLIAADCVIEDEDFSVGAKEVALVDYNFSIPVERCDLKRTWLSAYADKLNSEEDIFLDSLVPFVMERVAEQTRVKIVRDMVDEAALDASVEDVAAPTITDEASAYAGVASFIKGFTVAFLTESLGGGWYDRAYEIFVSPTTYSLLTLHLSDKTESVYVGAYRVRPEKALTANEMFCTNSRNILGVFDETYDLATIKVVPKEWINTDYIIGGLSFGGSYVDSSKITITDNF